MSPDVTTDEMFLVFSAIGSKNRSHFSLSLYLFSWEVLGLISGVAAASPAHMYIVQPAVDGGHRRQLIGDGREHERERHRPRAGWLAGWLLARYGMASPECTAFNSTLSIERREGRRTRSDDHDIGEYK